MIYLATPYSHPDPKMRQRRFDQVTDAAAYLLIQGELTYSPITHGHPIALAGGLPGDAGYWREHNEKMMDACDRLYVLLVFGWDSSWGVAREVKYARESGKEIKGLSFLWNFEGATYEVIDLEVPK
jgi:hypothetical protein